MTPLIDFGPEFAGRFGGRPGARRVSRVRHGERQLARSVLLLLLAVYTLAFTGLPDHADSETEFQTTSALGRGQGFALGGTTESDRLIELRALLPEDPRIPARVGPDGGTYSWFGTGQALVGVPFYWAGRALARALPEVEAANAERSLQGTRRSEYAAHLFVGWRTPLLAALTGWLVVLAAARLGLTRRASWITGMTYGLCTFALPQARSTLSDVQATAFLFGAFYLLLCARETLHGNRRPPRLLMAGLGACLAVAFLTRVAVAPAIAVLAIATLLVLARGRHVRDEDGVAVPWRSIAVDALAFAVPAGLGVLAFLLLNHARFGDPLESGYGAAVGASFFGYPAHLGLAGLLFAPGKGLLFLAPALVVAPLGWRWDTGRTGRSWVWVVLAVSVAVFAVVAPTATWHGAWTFGPRYVLPALPFLWLGVGVAVDHLWQRAWPRRGLLALFGLGFVANLGGTLVDHMTHQDLALQAAALEWPDAPGGDDGRFLNIQWEPRYAAPWAHWRILRRRLATGEETYPAAEVFMVPFEQDLVPSPELRDGFRHFAWVDLRALGGPSWPGPLLAALFAGAGLLLLRRASGR